MKEVRAQAKEMQRRISLVKSSLPCSYGFSADELVDAVMELDTVTGEGVQTHRRSSLHDGKCASGARTIAASEC
jgi:hypothetical protein